MEEIAVEEPVDYLEGVDMANKNAVRAALSRMFAASPHEPAPQDREEAKRRFAEKQAAYKARMRARGIDFDDLEASLARKEAEIKAEFESRLRASAPSRRRPPS